MHLVQVEKERIANNFNLRGKKMTFEQMIIFHSFQMALHEATIHFLYCSLPLFPQLQPNNFTQDILILPILPPKRDKCFHLD